jgi:hypothetical protein
MFCPKCKVEYTRGVRECSDCHLPLVESLPTNIPGSESVDPDATEVLWAGTDSDFAGALSDALDRAALPHSDGSTELGFLRAFRNAVYRVSVRPRDREGAERILQDTIDSRAGELPPTIGELTRHAATPMPYRGVARRVMKREPDTFSRAAPFESQGLFGSDSAYDRFPDEQIPDDFVEDFNPAQATSEVWAGADAKMAQYLDDCLRGVGIGCVRNDVPGQTRILVLPASEKRAREVIREIAEQSPPG